MGKTYRHMFLGKWNNGFQDMVPVSVKKFWDRHNFDKGKFLALRAKKRVDVLDDELYKILKEWE
jgi:hypothetical protein